MNAPGPGGIRIEALLDPAAYPHPVDAPVRLVETHVSWVLLTGPYAYKIKKPLQLSFLDYSTAERRRVFCEEELRLNRRHAPDLYLDVVTIVDTPDGLRIGGGSGPVIDHAVRMVQFDTREELDALIEQGRIERDELAALGAELGRLHSTAPPSPAAPGYGSPARVKRVTFDNFEELAALDLPTPVPQQLATLRAWAVSTYSALDSSLSARVAAGRIHECHGDLHCANVVRWRGRLTPFDAIEFDPALRHIDVVSDLAFLTMDLAARGRADLRHAALAAWTEGLGDYAALPLLPCYEIYRAVVRAKVAGLRARQSQSDSSRLQAALQTVRRYLDWASIRSKPAAPQLILTCGLSGSGKTWLARRLAVAMQALHVRSDVERKRLAGLPALADSRSPPDGGLYTLAFNARTYARLAECAANCLKGGENVIVDAASLRGAERHDLIAVAAAHAAPATILHCTAPIEVMRSRIAARRQSGSDASEADVTLLDRQPSYWEPLTDEEHRITVEVDTTDPRALDVAVERLQSSAADE
jgi:aminoglycoside phosphotransferase family enzyme/predicted kinase